MRYCLLLRTVCLFFLAFMLLSCTETSQDDDSFGQGASESSLASCVESIALEDEFPFENSEYPFVGLQRIVIETDSCERDIEKGVYTWASMRVYGEDSAQGESLKMRIKGRGNSSWNDMPKRGYKIVFEEKKSMLGMPRNKEWVLVANYADKSLMKNHLAYRLASDIGMEFSPRSEFFEFYLNSEYLGVYLLTESIEVRKNKVNLPEDMDSYLVEFDAKYNEGEQVVFANVLDTNKPFRIHYPKNASDSSLEKLLNHVESFERFLLTVEEASIEEISEWIDIDAFSKHFWVQEFAKNPDANYFTSVYFTWSDGCPIKMGPVWDFDVAFGGMRIYNEALALSENWRTRDAYWNARLFSNKAFADTVDRYWKKLSPIFEGAEGIIDSLGEALELPAQNNFKRWDILHEHGKWISNSVRNYGEAVNNLRKWVVGRRRWINENTP